MTVDVDSDADADCQDRILGYFIYRSHYSVAPFGLKISCSAGLFYCIIGVEVHVFMIVTNIDNDWVSRLTYLTYLSCPN